MKGYQITFFTQQDRYHQQQPLAEWLMSVARGLGVRGATVVNGSEGYGRNGRIHCAHFFELADQPQEVTMVVSDDEAARLFDLIEKDGVVLFYVKTPVEFGWLGKTED